MITPSAAAAIVGVTTGSPPLQIAGAALAGAASSANASAHHSIMKEGRFKSLQDDLAPRIAHDGKLAKAQAALASGQDIDLGKEEHKEAKAFSVLAQKLGRSEAGRALLGIDEQASSLKQGLDRFIEYYADKFYPQNGQNRAAENRRSALQIMKAFLNSKFSQAGDGDRNEIDELENHDVGDNFLLMMKACSDEIYDIATSTVRKSTLAMQGEEAKNPTVGKLSAGWHEALQSFLERRLACLDPTTLGLGDQIRDEGDEVTDEARENVGKQMAELRSELIGALTQHPDFVDGLRRALTVQETTLAPQFQGPFFHQSNAGLFDKIAHTESLIRHRVPWQPRYENYCYDLLRNSFDKNGLPVPDRSDRSARPGALAGREAHRIVSDIAAGPRRREDIPPWTSPPRSRVSCRSTESTISAHLDRNCLRPPSSTTKVGRQTPCGASSAGTKRSCPNRSRTMYRPAPYPARMAAKTPTRQQPYCHLVHRT